jgi:hypothetical protein
MDYIVTEDGSDVAIAVIQTKDDLMTIEKVKLAVKEEWSYDKVEVVESGGGINGMLKFALDCTTEDGDEEIRAVELNLIAVY